MFLDIYDVEINMTSSSGSSALMRFGDGDLPDDDDFIPAKAGKLSEADVPSSRRKYAGSVTIKSAHTPDKVTSHCTLDCALENVTSERVFGTFAVH